MGIMLQIGIVGAACMVGIILADRVPERLIPKPWRLQIGAIIAGIGVGLAFLAYR